MILILLVSFNSFSQNSLEFKDGKIYKATAIWDFICEDYAFDEILKIQIAKTQTGGIVKLTIKTSSSDIKIGDKVLLILKNGNIIHCIDKNLYTTTATERIAFYLLSNLEIIQLKKQNIENVRFKIIGTKSKFGSQTGHFTANNREKSYGLDKNLKNKYETAGEMRLLK